MKGYYDRFGEPRGKYTKEDGGSNVIILIVLLVLFAIIGVLSGCSNTSTLCPSYDVQGKYVQR